jgi:pyruvate kinase
MNMVICEAQHTGTIRLHKKMFLLDREIVSEMGASPIGVKDIIDINKIAELGIHIVTALVNNQENIEEIREILGTNSKDVKIFARIETSESMYKFDSILEKSDGIIINHGLISSKIPFEELCLVEMYMFEKCKIQQKPIYLQTNIIKSMIKRVKPLVTEISNLDFIVNSGIDGLILKEEITNSPNYIELIKVLKETLVQMEAFSDTKAKYEELSKFYKIQNEYIIDPTIESLLDSAVKTVFDVNVGLIILYTDNYQFAKALSKYRPNCRIICITNKESIYNYLRLMRGVSPFLYDFGDVFNNIDKLTNKIIETAKHKDLLLPNTDLVLVINAYQDYEKAELYKNGIYFFDSNIHM